MQPAIGTPHVLVGRRKLDRPGGLRAGSPPSPPPPSIRPSCGFSGGPRAYRVRVPIVVRRGQAASLGAVVVISAIA